MVIGDGRSLVVAKSERERERECVLIMMGGALCLGRCDCVWHCGKLYSLICAITLELESVNHKCFYTISLLKNVDSI